MTGSHTTPADVTDAVRLVRGDDGPVAICVGLDAAPRHSREEDQPQKVGLIVPAFDAAEIELGDVIIRA